ncbi:MAG: hypothetical protein JXC36_02400 [Candidatus Atribacteria bacterium]|nr:hypothetical protein [Candidatus Atribacteria bacterium]
MRNKRKIQQNRCPHCGKFFKPDNRTKDWQTSCRSRKCQVKRKTEAQRKWLKENPNYFTERYDNTKQWRMSHPDYQRKWRIKRKEKQKAKSSKLSVKSIKLIVPEKLFKGDIQDEIKLVKQCDCSFFVTGKFFKNSVENVGLKNTG